MNREPEEYLTQGQPQPTHEQSLIRLAAATCLMNRQKKVWEYWNYDRLTQKEIADKLSITPSAVSKQIKTIEKAITKWVKQYGQ